MLDTITHIITVVHIFVADTYAAWVMALLAWMWGWLTLAPAFRHEPEGSDS